jgi:hypothetical protein
MIESRALTQTLKRVMLGRFRIFDNWGTFHNRERDHFEEG